MSPYAAITEGHPAYAIQSAIRNVTGMQVGIPGTGFSSGFQWDFMKTLNPFDMDEAVGLKGLMWGSVLSIVLRALGVNRKFTQATSKIPILKRFSL